MTENSLCYYYGIVTVTMTGHCDWSDDHVIEVNFIHWMWPWPSVTVTGHCVQTAVWRAQIKKAVTWAGHRCDRVRILNSRNALTEIRDGMQLTQYTKNQEFHSDMLVQIRITQRNFFLPLNPFKRYYLWFELDLLRCNLFPSWVLESFIKRLSYKLLIKVCCVIIRCYHLPLLEYHGLWRFIDFHYLLNVHHLIASSLHHYYV